MIGEKDALELKVDGAPSATPLPGGGRGFHPPGSSAIGSDLVSQTDTVTNHDLTGTP